MKRDKVIIEEINDLWTQTEYANEVGLSKQTIQTQINRGNLSHVKINGAKLIRYNK